MKLDYPYVINKCYLCIISYMLMIISINTTEMVRSIFEVKDKMIIKDKTIKDEELYR